MISRRHFLQQSAALGATTTLGPVAWAAATPTYLPAVPGRPIPGTSGFGFESTAEEVTAGMDLSGKKPRQHATPSAVRRRRSSWSLRTSRA
jgi:hypothetical protein